MEKAIKVSRNFEYCIATYISFILTIYRLASFTLAEGVIKNIVDTCKFMYLQLIILYLITFFYIF